MGWLPLYEYNYRCCGEVPGYRISLVELAVASTGWQVVEINGQLLAPNVDDQRFTDLLVRSVRVRW